DPNRADTEVAEAEPTVRVDNQILRMAQGSDGYWYAYIGSDTEVSAADVAGNNLDFGLDTGLTQAGNTLLANTIGQKHAGVNGAGNDGLTNEALSILLSVPNSLGVISNPPTLSDYNGTNNLGATAADKQINGDQSSTVGQIGLNATEWPFIQTYSFLQGEFDIVLEQPGADEVVTLDYSSDDLDDYASLTLDRTSATQGAEVHVTIVDNQLNIDPTNEDIVVFYVPAAGTTGTVSFTNGTVPLSENGAGDEYVAYDNYFSDNGNLMINYDASSVNTSVLTNVVTVDDDVADQYLVFLEDADNSGIFTNMDDNDESSLEVNSAAKRGTTATFDYNDSAQSFVVANDFGTIDMDESSIGSEWNSGETLTVTLIDQDLNKNTADDEDLTISASDLIPSLKIGSPIVLNEANSRVEGSSMTVSSFSNIGSAGSTVLSATDHAASLSINLGTTVADFRAAYVAADFTFINYDIASLTAAVPTDVEFGDNGTYTKIADGSATTFRGLTQITGLVDTTAAIVETEYVLVNFTATAAVTAGDKFYVDIFTFGDRVNNAMYRLELEETGDNTATFVGDVEFIMINQINGDHVATFTDGITAMSDSIDIIVHEDMTDEDSPRINYLDLGADGVSTQIAD
ncbi:MAG: hypothetical protein ACKVJ1_11375, partial [Verrucomicrobiia bacterium]